MNPVLHTPVPAGTVLYGEVCGVSVPLPALQRGWLHGRAFTGPWNVRALSEAMDGGHWLSFYGMEEEEEGDSASAKPATVLCVVLPLGAVVELRLCGNAMLEDQPRYLLRIFAPSEALAATFLDQLRAGYLTRDVAAASGARIGLLNVSYSSIEVQRVRLASEQMIARSDLDLYYGEGAASWVDTWQERLRNRRYGLTLFTGDPGTGKTTLLRSFAAWTADSHQFYFMPAARFGNVDTGELVTFWANENRLSKLRKVLVLEDAESILLRRDGDNREKVASLLNLTDGVMGDALGLQVVCTLNSGVSEIDPALLRPGRLLGHREFSRLDGAQSARLAKHLGRQPPEGDSFSLAEIFNPESPTHSKPSATKRVVGFHVKLNT